MHRINIEFDCMSYSGKSVKFNHIFDCPSDDWDSWVANQDKSELMDKNDIFIIYDWKRTSIKKKKVFVFLNGGLGNDHYYLEKKVEKAGYKVVLIDNLYEKPYKIRKLSSIDPEHIFIFTANLPSRRHQIKNIIQYFKEMNYTPRSVIPYGRDAEYIINGLDLNTNEFYEVIKNYKKDSR